MKPTMALRWRLTSAFSKYLQHLFVHMSSLDSSLQMHLLERYWSLAGTSALHMRVQGW